MLRWAVSHSQLHNEPDSLTDNVTQVPQARSSEQAHPTERQPNGARGSNSFGQPLILAPFVDVTEVP